MTTFAAAPRTPTEAGRPAASAKPSDGGIGAYQQRAGERELRGPVRQVHLS